MDENNKQNNNEYASEQFHSALENDNSNARIAELEMELKKLKNGEFIQDLKREIERLQREHSGNHSLKQYFFFFRS